MVPPETEIDRIVAWDELLEDATYYELLGILEIADEVAIKQAFHEFVAFFHPDQHPDLEPEVESALRRVFQLGAEAYRVLIDPERRGIYDAGLLRGELRYTEESLHPGMAVNVGAKSLVDLCKTVGAKLHAKTADRMLMQGDLIGAKVELLLAIRKDGDNADLTERLDALDLALYAMGS